MVIADVGFGTELGCFASVGLGVQVPRLNFGRQRFAEIIMNKDKSKSEVDKELDEALEETFPGSDPIAVDNADEKAVRPANRQPPVIDKQLVERLSEKAKAKKD